jgi:hypothetical protein
MDQAIQRCADSVELDRLAKSLRGLARSAGGLSLRRTETLRFDAFVAGFTSAMADIKARNPEFGQAWVNWEHAARVLDDISSGLAGSAREHIRGQRLRLADRGEDTLSIPFSQKALSTLRDKDTVTELKCAEWVTKCQKAWLLSLGVSSSSILFDAAEPVKRFQLAQSEFRVFLRMRLLMLEPFVGPNMDVTCECNGIGDRVVTQGHGALCAHTSAERTARHNAICYALQEFLRLVLPANTTVQREVFVGDSAVADLRFAFEGTEYWVDVSVANPHIVSALQRHSDQESLVAASIRESTKRAHYAAALRNNGNRVIFIPFVLEATGAWGKAATEFLDKLCGIEGLAPAANEILASRRRFLKKNINVSLAIGFERIMLRWRMTNHYRPRDPGPPALLLPPVLNAIQDAADLALEPGELQDIY